jgi:hypothetical protein
MDAAFNLATMLAAPTTTPDAGNQQALLMTIMSIGLIVMLTSSFALLRGFVNDTKL